MQPAPFPMVHFGTARAERAALALRVIVWGGAIAFLAYTWSTEHVWEIALAWTLAGGACPGVLTVGASRLRPVLAWLSALVAPVLLVLSLVFRSRAVWMAFGFCFIAWGDWLDVKDQQRGVRSGWRLVSGALAIGALGVWLWLRLLRAE